MENNEYFYKLQDLSSSYTVLFVEDNLQYQESVLKFLNKLFKNVYIANDGIEGINVYNKEKIDLVLTGLNMPNKNGYEMIREIKRINADAEVLVLSSNTDSATLLSCIHLGISDFISKPADITKMIIIFLKVLSNMKRKDEILKQVRIKNEKNKEILSFLYENSMSIDIINYYKGLLFRSSTYIKEIKNEYIKLKVNNLQLLACKNEKSAVLDSSLIGENIYCSLEEINEDDYEIILKKENFFYPKLKNINEIALEAGQSVKAYFLSKNKKVICKINMISKKELFLSFENEDEKLIIKEHNEMTFYVYLKNESDKKNDFKKIEGIVYKIEKNNSSYKMTLLIKKDKIVNEYIEKYILKREDYLLKEFKKEFFE